MESLIPLLTRLLSNAPIRHLALKLAERRIYHEYVEANPHGRPKRVQENKYLQVRSMLRAVSRAMDGERIAESCRAGILRSLVHNTFLGGTNARREFLEAHGFEPPFFLTISPGKKCNLRCRGCYAASGRMDAERLPWPTLERIVEEQERLWGSYFTVISGGEPFLYRDHGNGLIDLAQRNPGHFFLVFTNGTLIDDEVAGKLASAGNMVPAVSVEGGAPETDARRGKGTFAKVLSAFAALREAGVPFGLSITATRANADLVQSDPFIDFFFGTQKALFAWLFQYMPIGRHADLDNMVTSEQRIRMYHRTWDLVENRSLFLADFWNSGTVSNGCIAGGRSGGYFHIDWNGNATPCVFNPYHTHNINAVYGEGGDLNTVLLSPFFQSIRRWQDAYCLGRAAHEMNNLIRPCAIRDHPRMMRALIARHGAKPASEDAARALADPEYWDGLACCGRELKTLSDPIWNEEYIGPERVRLHTHPQPHGRTWLSRVTRMIKDHVA